MKAVPENYIIQTVSRAMDLLEQFQEGEAELGITDLSNRLNLQKNNVFRLVATLKAKNYIEMNSSTGKYRLGIKTRALGQVASRLTDYASLAHPYLYDIKKQCHETCYFSVIRDGYTYYLDGVESDLPVRVAQRVGCSRPTYDTAAGWVQLAGLEPQRQAELLSATNAADQIGDLAALQRELKLVAEKGYCIDDQEHDAGVVEIAVPVFGPHGTIVGALSILGPAMRLAASRVREELLPLLCQAAVRLSNSLGHGKGGETRADIILYPPTPKRKARKLAPKPHIFGELKSFC